MLGRCCARKEAGTFSRSAESRLLFAQELTTRLAGLPGVQATSVATIVPLAGDIIRRNVDVRGHTIQSGASVLVNVVGPRYFETMGISMIRGREFRCADRSGSPPVALLLVTFPARAFLLGVSPVDPIAVALTASLLLIGGLCASSLPALRATRVDPLIALRQP